VNKKALAPLWSAVEKQVLMWYCGVDAAAADSTAENEIEMVVFVYTVSQVPQNYRFLSEAA